MKKKIIEFLDSFDGQFVPLRTRELLTNQLKEFDKFIEENDPLPQEPISDKIIEAFAAREQEYYDSLTYEEKVEELFRYKFQSFKAKIRNKGIYKKIKDPANE